MITLLALFLSIAHADEPSNKALIGAGLGMAAPMYFVGVATHEGSHALATKLMGKKVGKISIIPSRLDDGHLVFGYTEILSPLTDRQDAIISMAPSLTDLVVVGVIGALLATDNMPANKYAQLAITEFGTAAVVDFSVNMLARGADADVKRVYKGFGIKSKKARVAARVLHGALAAGSAYVVYEGYKKLFTSQESGYSNDGPKSFMLPLAQGAF